MKKSLRHFVALLSISLPVFLAGCSQDVASVDDVRMPMTAQERFPIAVEKVPVKLTIRADHGYLSNEDLANLRQFAQAVRNSEFSNLTVSYPSRSTKARKTADHAVRTLSSEGVARDMIEVKTYNGASNVVSLVYLRKAAVTKPCGDWSRNMANDSKNVGYPNLGCTAQHNLAAMVSNPADLQRPRTMTSPPAAGQMPAMKNYESGDWSKVPAPLPTATMD